MTLTATQTDEIDADAYRADLHARCSYFTRGQRRECDWAISGYCKNCGRERPSTLARPARPRMTHAQAKKSPVIRRLGELAREFDDAAAYYAKYSGEHNALLRAEANRSAGQLRLVSTLVVNGTFTQTQGADWIKAGWRVINVIGRSNLT